MTSERVHYRELVKFAIGGGWGAETAEDKNQAAVTIIRGTDFARARNGQLEDCPQRYETEKRRAKRVLVPEDIVLEISGGNPKTGQSTGRSLFVTQRMLQAAPSPAIPASFCRLVRVNREIAVPRYSYYLLQEMWQSGRARMYENQSTGLANFQFEYFLDEEQVWLPIQEEQERIAGVLGALDNKIDSNGRLAALLEETAATAFRARFVDFVGVEEFAKSEIGPIPRGWRTTPFSDAVEINPAVPLRKGAVAPFIEMAAVAPWGVRPSNITERQYSGGARFQPGDTLMARITGCIEHGKGAFIDFLAGPGSGSTEFLVFRAKPPLTPEAVFLLSREDRVRSHAIANMTGSSGRQRVAKGCFDDLQIAVPPDVGSWREDAEFLRAAFAQSRGLWRESRSLAAIRNALLPKLISGEIRVPDTADPDEVVEAAIEEVSA